MNDKSFTLHDGDFCIIRKGEKFRYMNNSNEIVLLVLVHTPNFIMEEEIYELNICLEKAAHCIPVTLIRRGMCSQDEFCKCDPF